ncbi:hypothetical protein [Massilia orientalis]|uniref:Uncharacterized protein n=1 Tax=Massilia orientalis TaxID=3050128 RepID=A0ACC7MLH1_9BURK|nr:hypothetical protein [Massilia sp. YIM B02787]
MHRYAELTLLVLVIAASGTKAYVTGLNPPQQPAALVLAVANFLAERLLWAIPFLIGIGQRGRARYPAAIL